MKHTEMWVTKFQTYGYLMPAISRWSSVDFLFNKIWKNWCMTNTKPAYSNKFMGSTNQPANTNTWKNMSLSPLDTNLKFFHGFLDFHKVHKVLQPNNIFNK